MKRFLPQITIALVVVLITILHFLTPLDQTVWHEIYQRLYYIPIIAAALLFGLRGGLAASIFTTVIYSPHIFFHWQHNHFDYSINQYAEIVIFNLVGGITGTLGDQLKQARERAERSAEERRKAYDELQKTFEQLLQAEKLSSLGEMSAGIVHEVRNPLAAIKGAVEILEDELAEDSPRREFVAIAKQEIERINKLVGEFLHYARPPKPEKKPTDINHLIHSVQQLFEGQTKFQEIEIIENFAGKLSDIRVDAEQLKQVLVNLTLNAIQAMPNGGTLTFSTFQKEKTVTIEVQDTGEGINENQLLQIFDPFFTTKPKGVGLGLSIAYRIVSQNNGKITARNNEKGATFTLSFDNR